MLVSIVIITLNEAENLALTIKNARLAAQLPSGRSLPVEIIVSDGGSSDGTIKIAEELADKVIHAPKGRSNQLNAGANSSKGDIMLFLHADTLLPMGAILRIIWKLKDPCAMGGAFRKYWRWDPKGSRSKLLKFVAYFWEGFGNWLVDLIRTFPGDNAIFVRREIFESLKGFAPLWICEDFDFVRRLKKLIKKSPKCSGVRRTKLKSIVYVKSAVETSTRRFDNYGFFRVLYMWFFIYWLWRLGMSQDRLKTRFKKYSIEPRKN